MRTKHWHVDGFGQYEDGRSQICLTTTKRPRRADYKRLLKKAWNYGQVARFDYYDHKKDKGTVDLYLAFKEYRDAEKFLKEVMGWNPKGVETTKA